MIKVILFIVTIVYGFSKKRIRQIPDKFYWIWIAFLLAFIVDTSEGFADYVGNSQYYDYVFNGGVQKEYRGYSIGWYYICMIGKILNLSSMGLYVLVIFLSMFLMNKVVQQYSSSPRTFWTLFLIFPALVQVVQIRFFLATAIIFYSFKFLAENNRIGLIKYTLGVLVAYCIHASSVVFMIFLLICLIRKVNVYKVAVAGFIGVIVVYLSLDRIKLYASEFLTPEKYNRYFSSTISQSSFSWIVKIVFIWAICAVGTLLVNRKYGVQIISGKNVISETVASKIITCEWLLVVTLPLLSFDSNFHRFLEVGYMLSYLILSNIFRKLLSKPNERLSFIIIIVFLLMFVVYIFIPYDTVLIPFATFSGFRPLFA